MMSTVAGIFGLCLGSFGTALLPRLQSGESLWTRSRCPHCRSAIAAHDLIPGLSFLILQGSCRTCQVRISAFYPLLELATGLLWIGAVFFLRHQPLDLLLVGAAGTILLYLSATDLLSMSLPDALLTPLFAIALFTQSFAEIGITSGVGTRSGMIAAGIALSWFGSQILLSQSRWVGSGDLLLGVCLGVLLGPRDLLLTLFLAYTVATAIAIPLLALKVWSRTSKIPFVPFLVIGTLLSTLFGDDLVSWYLSLL